ncbi:phytase [Chlorobium sp.]|jgi:3-phytase|uniref:phytase n=1 Tax=Chlorobium sp. TaxID=1095 RepID=UPI001E07184C|nr:phytase [Chlorobium sp.]MBN1278995.1 phytase [Chlorobiaceae bacterium]
MVLSKCFVFAVLLTVSACSGVNRDLSGNTVKPVVVSEKVPHDADDPAIWVNPADHDRSLILGTDKHEDGAVYVFDLQGRIIAKKCVYGLRRPNNIDVEYGLILNGKPVDIAVVTERLTGKLRVFTLPDMKAVDKGGIPVFTGERDNAPMGVALYKRKHDGAVYAIVSRKQGPADGTYLWQYRLEDNGKGFVQGSLARKFGKWSGKKEIEAVAVDDGSGFVYYSDEGIGVRKYHADPDVKGGEEELALFATNGFAKDHEGIAVSSTTGGSVIIISDQAAGQLHLFRESAGSKGIARIGIVKTEAIDTDGIDAASVLSTTEFPYGILVAMSNDRTFHYYSLKDLGLLP